MIQQFFQLFDDLWKEYVIVSSIFLILPVPPLILKNLRRDQVIKEGTNSFKTSLLV